MDLATSMPIYALLHILYYLLYLIILILFLYKPLLYVPPFLGINKVLWIEMKLNQTVVRIKPIHASISGRNTSCYGGQTSSV